MALSRVLNANHGLKHEHSSASQDFKNENGNVQYSSVLNLSGIFGRIAKTIE